MGEDLGGEDPRAAGDTGDVPGLSPEEPLDDVVDEGAVLRQRCRVEERVDLGVEATELVRVEEVLTAPSRSRAPV
jgi:hypothetical protein